VEFALEKLHMVQFERKETGLAIRAAASVPYPVERSTLFADRKSLRKFVRGAMESAPFKGRRVYSALPAPEVRIIPLTLHVSGAQSEQSAVIKALREKMRSDLANEVVDYLQLRGGEATGTELNVLAAVAQRDTVLCHLGQLDDLGMEPVALDIGPAALARLLATMQHDDHDQSVLLINFGAEHSYITVVWGRRLILDRELEFSESRLVAKLGASLGIERHTAQSMLKKYGLPVPEDENNFSGSGMGRAINEILYPEFAAIAEELGRTLIYIASKTRGRTVKCIYLNGNLAHYPYIAAKMQKLVEIPVEILNPFSALQPATPAAYSAILNPSQGIAMAAGLALRD
jgi:Tfp pilus assembly PilM family ATPase